MLKILIYSAIFLQILSERPDTANCSLVEIDPVVSASSQGLANATIEVIVKGGGSDIKYIFCDETGKVLNEDHTNKNTIVNLKAGTYYCIVSTGKCTKKVEVSVP